MKKSEICSYAADLYQKAGESILTADADIPAEYDGLRLYDAPLVGFGSANDPLFDTFKKPEVIGPWHMSPNEWLANAKTVISFFFPASETVRRSNAGRKESASMPWVYARIEGQAFIGNYAAAMAEYITKTTGALCCVPQADPRWQAVMEGKGIDGCGLCQTGVPCEAGNPCGEPVR